jgi:invasion protein IalB
MVLLGVALSAVAAAALYVVIGAPSPADVFGLIRGERRIARGFIGVANFGQWRLICAPGPATLDALGNAASAGQGAAPGKAPNGNTCRGNQEMPAAPQGAAPGEKPAQVVVAANFSLVGRKRTPAAMLRLPPTAEAGDVISLRFDDGSEINTKVRDCALGECFAAGTLSGEEWQHLSATNTLQVKFPVTGRQWVILDLPVQGLSAAIGALGRAEIRP